MRVKDEAAGKKIRCPGCSTVLTVPKPETPKDAEEDALKLLLEEADEPAPAVNHDVTDDAPATDAIQPPRPGPRPPPPPEPPPPQWKWRKKKLPPPEPIRKPKAKSGGGLFNNVNPNYSVVGVGCLMMFGGAALLIVGLATGWIIIGAAFLFFSGLGTFFKGLMGRSD
jgi:hypothetical protein